MIEAQYHPSARPEMKKFITNSPKVTLEVGCREAFFSKSLQESFDIKESWGVEPDDIVKEVAEKNLTNFIIGFYSKELDLPKNHFDLVIFNDVLEHIYDPWEVLKFTKTILKKDGIIVASIPNIRHKSVLKNLLFKDDFTYERAGILDVTHIRFFTKSTMVKLFQESGFTVENIEPVVLIKKRRFYKKILQFPKNLLHFLTFNRFKSIEYAQYGITARIAE